MSKACEIKIDSVEHQNTAAWLKEAFPDFSSIGIRDSINEIVAQLGRYPESKEEAVGMTYLIREVTEPDASISRSKLSNQIYLANENLKRIEAHLGKVSTATPAQRRTLSGIKKMIQNYIAYLNELKSKQEIKGESILKDRPKSVSELKGTANFTNPEEYNQYKLFGQFIHFYIEKILIARNVGKKGNNLLSMTSYLEDREFFNNVLKEWNSRPERAFIQDIKNLTEDHIFNLVGKTASQFLTVKMDNARAITLPEVIVYGRDFKNKPIIGRADAFIIDDEGAVTVVDYKTKKVPKLILSSTPERNYNKIIKALDDSTYSIQSKGAHPGFKGQTRSVFLDWGIQTRMYERMLAQNDIPIKDSHIVAFVYSIANRTGDFSGADVITNTPRGMMIGSRNEVNYKEGEKTFNASMDEVDRLIPLEPQQEKKLSFEDAARLFPFDLTQDQWLKMKKIIQDIIEKNKAEIRTNRTEAKKNKDQALEDFYNLMFIGLNNFEAAVTNDRESVAAAIKFQNVLSYIEQIVVSAVKETESIKNLFSDLQSFYKSTTNTFSSEYTDALNRIINIHKSVFATQSVYSMLKQLVDQALQDPNNKTITQSSPVVQRIRDLEAAYTAVEMHHANANAYTMAVVLAKMNVENAEVDEQGNPIDTVQRLVETSKEAIEPRIAILQKEKDELLNGGSLSLKQTVKSNFSIYLSKIFKNKNVQKLTTGDRAKAQRIEEIDREIEALNIAMKVPGAMRSIEEIKKMLDNITDPSSMYYLGAPIDINQGFISKLSFADDLIASITSGNPLIAAHTKLLKMFSDTADYNITNDPKRAKLDKSITQFTANKSMEEANAAVTESREVIILNDKGEIERKNKASLVQPVSQEFYEFFRMHSPAGILRRQYLQKRKELNSQLALEKDPVKIKEVKDAIRSLESEESNRRAAFTEFEKNFTHTPYKKIFYDYLLSVGKNVSEELKSKFEQLTILMDRHGLFNDELRYQEYRKRNYDVHDIFEEMDTTQEETDEDSLSDYETINQLMVEINELKQKHNTTEENEKAIERFQQLFEVKINYALFERIKAQKENLYANRDTNALDKQMYEDWLRENAILTPTEEWYEALNEIYTALADLKGQDQDLKDLMSKRSALLRKYKINHSIIDPNYITKEDYKAYVDLEIQIEERLDFLKKLRSDDTFDETANDLYTALRKLKTKKANPLYETELKNKTEQLNKAYEVFSKAEQDYELSTDDEKAEAANRLKFAREQFNLIEANYETWYNGNHINKYESVMNSDPMEVAEPLPINMISYPATEVEARFTELKPSRKYTYRVLKESAKNSNYQEALDNSRLPIALKRDGIKLVINDEFFNDALIDDSLKAKALSYVNPKYLTLMNDKEKFDFYNDLTDAFFSIQKRMKGRVTGYLVPAMESTTVEIYKNNSLKKAISIGAKRFYDNNLKIVSQDDFVLNTYGDDGREIRSRYSIQYDDDLQSIDAISSVRAWMIEGHYNIAMSEVQPLSKSYIAGLRSLAEALAEGVEKAPNKEQREILTERLNSLESAIRISEAEHEKFIRGYTDENKDRVLKKITTNLMRAFSLARIGFDIVNQSKNFISGNVQLYLNSASSMHWTANDLRWAKTELYGNFMRQYIRSWGKIDDVDPAVQLYRVAQPSQGDIRKYALDIAGGKSRRLLNKVLNIQELAYMLQDKGDKEISFTVWLAIMHNKRVQVLDNSGQPIKNADGSFKTMSLYEAVDISKEGYITIKPNANTTLDAVRHWTLVAQNEIIRTQGNYAASDKTRIERFLPGVLIMFYRKYLIPMFLNRVGFMRNDWITNEVQYGYYRAIATIYKQYGPMEFFKSLLLAGTLPDKFKKSTNMNAFYSRKAMHLSRDMMMSFVFVMLVLMSQTYLNSLDDDEEVDILLGNAIRVLWGVDREVRSMNPLPMVGGTDEYIRNFTTLTTLTREFQLFGAAIGHSFAYLLVRFLAGNEDPAEDPDGLVEEFYALAYKWAYYSRKSGVYEEGDPKILKDFHDLTGYKNINALVNPGEKLETMSKTYF